MNLNGAWLDAGADALAQRRRNALLDRKDGKRRRGMDSAPSRTVQLTFDRLRFSAATEKYFSNCEKRGLNSKTVRKYRTAVEPFIQHCGVTYIDECRDNKQPLLDYMGWLRNAPVPKRKHGNPSARSLARSGLGTSRWPPRTSISPTCANPAKRKERWPMPTLFPSRRS